jgi:SAM-dependent methyltransferase
MLPQGVRVTHWIRPAWFDEARLIVQGEHFASALAERRLHGKVLNAGCGEGLYAPFLEHFPDVTAIVNVDLSAPSVSRRRTDRRHHDLRASLTSLPFAAGSFDAAICSEVLEHVPDDRTAVAELARVLRPGSMLLVSVPTPPAPHDPAHVREGYTREALTSLLRAHDLDVLSVRYCMHVVMRTLYNVWQWQHRVAGRNLFPRAILRALARADALTHAGQPWDLVAVAVRRG